LSQRERGTVQHLGSVKSVDSIGYSTTSMRGDDVDLLGLAMGQSIDQDQDRFRYCYDMRE